MYQDSFLFVFYDHSKPDMSRLRLAAACALLKLAQEPCYHEIITLEQYQLCALVINVRARTGSRLCRTSVFRMPIHGTPAVSLPSAGRVLPGATVFLPEAQPRPVPPPPASGVHGRVCLVRQGPREGEEGSRSPVFGEKRQHSPGVPQTALCPQW